MSKPEKFFGEEWVDGWMSPVSPVFHTEETLNNYINKSQLITNTERNKQF